MATPVLDKLRLWRESRTGLKTRFSDEVNPPVSKRDDVPDLVTNTKIKRGDRVQSARIKHYPSVDVNYDNLFAGYIEGDLSDARDRLLDMGYRNNPTAYVEVTDEYGPDDGSYARQYITETGGGSRPYLTNFPSLYAREKKQIHVCIWDVDDEVHFLAHDERSAWLQPMLHVSVPDSNARIGVRDFRDDWYDNFGEELPGSDDVKWEVNH